MIGECQFIGEGYGFVELEISAGLDVGGKQLLAEVGLPFFFLLLF